MLSTHSFYGMIQWFNMPFEQSWQWFMWFSKHCSEKNLDVRIADYNKNISSHLRSLKASEQTQISESTLILSCSRVFVSPVLITTFKICQVHRDRFGIYWKSSSVECKHPINEDSKKCWPGHLMFPCIGNILGVENWEFSFLKYYDTRFEIKHFLFNSTSRMQLFESVWYNVNIVKGKKSACFMYLYHETCITM
jgi:hypothetical protein